MGNAREFLWQNLCKEASNIGRINTNEVNRLTNDWMNDDLNDKHRYEKISSYLKKDCTILDMASGCGTFVFLGLKLGYNVYGIDPEKWKFNFIQLKARENAYPLNWIDKFCIGTGEDLPYQNNTFDIVSTYQTLEHVQNIPKCIAEMIRVAKPGGIIHIECPDYRGTFEPHYNIPFLPLFPKNLAKIYLKLLGKNPKYLDQINYTTKSSLSKEILKSSIHQNVEIEIIDMHKYNYCKFGNPYWYILAQLKLILSRLFKKELSVHLIVKIKKLIE